MSKHKFIFIYMSLNYTTISIIFITIIISEALKPFDTKLISFLQYKNIISLVCLLVFTNQETYNLINKSYKYSFKICSLNFQI